MSRIILEGGTDVAEMVLFSVDELPSGGADNDTLSNLVSNEQAIRMPTGANGAYLLHLYVDDEVPNPVIQYCVLDDALESKIRVKSGQIAFGGAESTFAEFEPNPNIRADSGLAQGVYDAIGYRTDFPDELVAGAVENVIGRDGMRAVNFPGKIILGTVVLTILLLIIGFSANPIARGGAVAVVIGGVLWFKFYTGSDKFKRLNAQKLEVEYEYPSIVVQLSKRRD